MTKNEMANLMTWLPSFAIWYAFNEYSWMLVSIAKRQKNVIPRHLSCIDFKSIKQTFLVAKLLCQQCFNRRNDKKRNGKSYDKKMKTTANVLEINSKLDTVKSLRTFCSSTWPIGPRANDGHLHGTQLPCSLSDFNTLTASQLLPGSCARMRACMFIRNIF